MCYGVEIWSWRAREGLERLEERYIRWILGVDLKKVEEGKGSE